MGELKLISGPKPAPGSLQTFELSYREFAIAGAALGLLAGLFEAAYLRLLPRYTDLVGPDPGPPIWWVAPLVDLVAFGLLGLLTGLVAGRWGTRTPTSRRAGASMGLGAVSLYVTAVLFRGYFRAHTYALGFSIALVIGLAVSCISYLGFRDWRRNSIPRIPRFPSRHPFVALGALLAAFFLIFAFAARGTSDHRLTQTPVPNLLPGSSRPNVVFITLDTARSDHFSSYGYARATTPNIDRLASRGVLFENAVSPSSWTFPSFASMFTGLLPHQHGASADAPLDDPSITLARLLQSQGYETAGFNSNFLWGQKRLGLGQGFDVYDDGSSGFIQNAACTLLGGAIYRMFYYRLIYPNFPGDRDAAQTNQAVTRWLRHRSGRPFFLFINYFDTHAPYLAPAPDGMRFGTLPYRLVRKVRFAGALGNPRRLSPEEMAALVNGYDNCLAYVDGQIGELIELLSRTRDGLNTIVVVTADHGESLGEHGYLGHGWGLQRELLHVPLLIAGPGIPKGMRITGVATTRRIFATILNWAGRGDNAVAGNSLSAFWSRRLGGEAPSKSVISELYTGPATEGGNAFVSLMTTPYHYIRDTRGQRQLFDWHKDPQEENDLASLPEYAATLSAMEKLLDLKIRATRQPWRGLGYAAAFGMGKSSSTGDMVRGHSGASRSVGKPQSEDEELLKSLPY